MTPFSKVKTWIKQGFYEKLPSSKSLRGALDLQQEIMDSMIREGLLLTVNCCTYYPTFPIITLEELEAGGVNFPVYGTALIYFGGDAAIITKLPDGTFVFVGLGGF